MNTRDYGENSARKPGWPNRRDIIRGTGMAAAGGMLGRGTDAAASELRVPVTTYETIGVEPIINCWGTITMLGGSLMPPEVMEAMHRANSEYIYFPELIEGVGKRLADLTGAEWGCVTSGAAGAIYVSTAACVAGDDRQKMAQLPDTTGMKSEAIIPARHYTGYHDAACRMVGLELKRPATTGEMEDMIGENTAIVYILGEVSRPGNPDGGDIPYRDIIRIARAHGVPTMVDAAAEEPNVPNHYLETGADLVTYSGGKCLRGPQSAGLLLGRKDLISAASLNMSPFGGIGRTMKVGKEEIMGVLTALDLWLKGRDHDAEYAEWERMLGVVTDMVTRIPTVTTEVVHPERPSNVAPRLAISWDRSRVKITDEEFHDRLLSGYPRIKVQAGGRRPQIMPYQLRPGDEEIVARRMYEILSEAAS